ncbi:Rid family hydrolase [Streptomyces sp. NPDC045251]|uniref:Rid family hydrolase n=1 Tax=unclassified Streptomyces TaxID=2593676 RepID=UPI0034046F07
MRFGPASGSPRTPCSSWTAPWSPPATTRLGDLAGQVAQALRNTFVGLAGAGASFADVLRLTLYVTQWSPEKIGDFMAGVEAVADEIGLRLPMPSASLIGVDHLFDPVALVEVETTALLS